MRNFFLVFIFLKALSIFLGADFSYAQILSQENFNTHLRWNLNVPKDQFYIVKRGETLFIETVNLELFKMLNEQAQQIELNKKYIESFSLSKDSFPEKPATLSVKLKNASVELFSFYNDVEKKYILDFWLNEDQVSARPSALKKVEAKTSKVDSEITKSKSKNRKKIVSPKKNNIKKIGISSLASRKSSLLNPIEVNTTGATDRVFDSKLRDFRYGASFIWDYPAMIPDLEKDINMSSKSPDYIFPIKDRTNLDDPKEAHMQLSINFFNEKKWGLMNKSITLYEKKYGKDNNHVLNQFLKANALLKENIINPNPSINKSAMIMLSNIKDLTNDYELKSAVLRYLIQYHINEKDYVKTLELAKDFYVSSRENFDDSAIIKSSLVILHSLAELKQLEKISEFLADNKKLNKVLPAHIQLAYSSFVLLSKDLHKDLIKSFSSQAKSLVKPVHPAILYNVAEAYFRNAEYDQAIKYFDEFLSDYSHMLLASSARLRIALSYEILDKPVEETLLLYKKAIDRSPSPGIRYEAKLRYVALRMNRIIEPNKEDLESEIFLDQSPDEAKSIDRKLKKLLWLTRLRIFINKKKYDEALSYLSSLPLDLFKPSERRVFEGDGAEIVFGLIQNAYIQENYAKAIKIWEVYKNKYENKVAANIYVNFIVCDSLIKLGLYESFDRALLALREVQNKEQRNFPIWVDRLKSLESTKISDELKVMRLIADDKWSEAEAKLTSQPVSKRDSVTHPFYLGIIYYNQKKYTESVMEFEKILLKKSIQKSLTPRQTADLLMSYVDSLYQLKDQNKFKTVVTALSKDINQSTSAPILNIAERINYLLIESYAGDKKAPWRDIEMMTNNFRKKFPKSPYIARITYLNGLSLLKNAKVPEGRKVFSELINNSEVPLHIKEMCKSELSLLELREKSL